MKDKIAKNQQEQCQSKASSAKKILGKISDSIFFFLNPKPKKRVADKTDHLKAMAEQTERSSPFQKKCPLIYLTGFYFKKNGEDPIPRIEGDLVKYLMEEKKRLKEQ